MNRSDLARKTATKKTSQKAAAPKIEANTWERVRRGERVLLRQGKKPFAAVVPLADLKALVELEDRLDVEVIEKALAEPGRSIPFEEYLRKRGR